MVDRSVRCRWPDIAPYCDPRELSTAAVDAVVAVVETGAWSPIDRADRWFVRQFRWRDIQQALEAGDQRQAKPHARPRAWQADRPDLELPTAALAAQLAHVQERHEQERAPIAGIQFGEHGPLHDPPFASDPATALQAMGVTETWPWVRYVGEAP